MACCCRTSVTWLQCCLCLSLCIWTSQIILLFARVHLSTSEPASLTKWSAEHSLCLRWFWEILGNRNVNLHSPWISVYDIHLQASVTNSDWCSTVPCGFRSSWDSSFHAFDLLLHTSLTVQQTMATTMYQLGQLHFPNLSLSLTLSSTYMFALVWS